VVVVAPETLPDGTILLDATSAATLEAVREAQTELAEWRSRGHDTVHVVGHIADTTLEEADALGRRTVRLNIGHFVVVGGLARVIHLAAEQEGSWDGESLPCSDESVAYDEVSRMRGDSVVVLVTSSTECDMAGLVARLKGES
jgi:UDP-N-acetylmuramoyl-tripeptide--D-alanyl-D-alanine ligase